MARSTAVLVYVLILVWPASGRGQSFVLQGAAGPTIIDSGHSLAAGIGFSPSTRITVSFNVDRTHLASRSRPDGRGGVAGFRGGTVTTGAAELRVSLFPQNRIGPYGLAAFAVGVARPNVNEMFSDRFSNDVRAVSFGGGLQIPTRRKLSLFGDVRTMVGSEAGELLAVSVVRAGLAWRF